ncbi:MAG: hypothetical protein M3275_15680, partial [Thermoproteota archaeon]|nr:hypothetical protein [Thermoproteota archaeon]
YRSEENKCDMGYASDATFNLTIPDHYRLFLYALNNLVTIDSPWRSCSSINKIKLIQRVC